MKGKKNKTTTELWLEKFYKHETNFPEPFPHELVERLETYLDVSFTFIHMLVCVCVLEVWYCSLNLLLNTYMAGP